MKPKILLILAIILPTSALAEYCNKEVINNLKRITNSNPIEDANNSLLKGDTRYLATFGYSYEFPGVPNSKNIQIISSKHFAPIEGSGDNLCTWPEAPEDLRLKIEEYAKTYNQFIISKQ